MFSLGVSKDGAYNSIVKKSFPNFFVLLLLVVYLLSNNQIYYIVQKIFMLLLKFCVSIFILSDKRYLLFAVRTKYLSELQTLKYSLSLVGNAVISFPTVN